MLNHKSDNDTPPADEVAATSKPRSALQNQLNEVIFGTETPAGKRFDIFLIVTILLSVLIVIADSINVFHQRYDLLLTRAEWLFTILFTLEYIARLYCAPHPWRYAKSFYGVIDFLSIIPTYIALIFPAAHYALIVRLLRVMRLFRVLRLLRYSTDANLLLRSIWQSRRRIQIFLFTVVIIATIVGSMMYLIEGQDSGFTSIPQSIYWAIVTITTVGYGDIVPLTYGGKVLASLAMVIGYSIIAVPTGIITAELANELRIERSAKKCDSCGRAGHENDALHCRFCGALME